MNLRNKKTGEIAHFAFIRANGPIGNSSLAEIANEWEDADGTNVLGMPLIKDEKIRKAVRAWAEANEEERVQVRTAYSLKEFKGLNTMLKLELTYTRTQDEIYTIAELCGEEEE